MSQGGEIAAIPLVAKLRIRLVAQACINAVLDIQPRGEVGGVVNVGEIGHLLLADGLRAQ